MDPSMFILYLALALAILLLQISNLQGQNQAHSQSAPCKNVHPRYKKKTWLIGLNDVRALVLTDI